MNNANAEPHMNQMGISTHSILYRVKSKMSIVLSKIFQINAKFLKICAA